LPNPFGLLEALFFIANPVCNTSLFTHEPAGVILKSRFAELSILYPTLPRQF
jgi:hypothetical protein